MQMYGIRRKNCKFTPENEWVRRVLNSVLCMIDLQTNNLMSKVLIIGAGGVGTVVAHKVAKNEIFTDIMLASRTKSKCDQIAAAVGGNRIQTAQVDADRVEELVALMRSFQPDIVINVALPYQDLTIMDACLECGVNYLDTANYEPKDEAHFEYS